jgi:hypothetical protein
VATEVGLIVIKGTCCMETVRNMQIRKILNLHIANKNIFMFNMALTNIFFKGDEYKFISF